MWNGWVHPFDKGFKVDETWEFEPVSLHAEAMETYINWVQNRNQSGVHFQGTGIWQKTIVRILW